MLYIGGTPKRNTIKDTIQSSLNQDLPSSEGRRFMDFVFQWSFYDGEFDLGGEVEFWWLLFAWVLKVGFG
jgi:hypothetical protein